MLEKAIPMLRSLLHLPLPIHTSRLPDEAAREQQEQQHGLFHLWNPTPHTRSSYTVQRELYISHRCVFTGLYNTPCVIYIAIYINIILWRRGWGKEIWATGSHKLGTPRTGSASESLKNYWAVKEIELDESGNKIPSDYSSCLIRILVRIKRVQRYIDKEKVSWITRVGVGRIFIHKNDEYLFRR